MTDSALPADTVDVDLGGRTVPDPRGGWFDRYRMAAPLDEVAADPRVPGVDFFRTLPKTVVQSPIGETCTPNFYYAMSSARLTMVAPTRAIRRHVPDDLAPLRIAPGLGLVSLMLFRYDVCDIDFYTEAAVGIAVRPARHGGAGVADLTAALGNDHLHAYVLSLPVNTEIAQVRGHDGYGFPKWVTDLDVDIDADRTSARIANADGGIDLAFSAPTPTQKRFAGGEHVSTLTSYTRRDGAWHSTLNQTNILAAAWAPAHDRVRTDGRRPAGVETVPRHPVRRQHLCAGRAAHAGTVLGPLTTRRTIMITTPTTMRAIVVDHEKRLVLEDVPTPTPARGEVLVRVAAAGINRADLLQRQGLYPPPPGITDIMGMEVSGIVVALGPGVDGPVVGTEVCALIAGGGYADYAVVPAAQLLPVPAGVSLVDAAALPEVASTVWSTIVADAGLREGELLLIHGGGSGIGTHAIQVAKALGARVAVTVGLKGKAQRCRDLGADTVINYREQDFAVELAGQADVILDIMGGSYLTRNIDALAVGGRLVIIGMQGGFTGEVNVGALIGKRARIIGLNVRNRPLTGPGSKAEIVADVAANEWPLVAAGLIAPVISAKLPLADAEKGQELLESSSSVGKVLLLPGD